MNARTKLLRDAGLLPLACAIMLAGAGTASAAKRPDPMNGLAKQKRTPTGVRHNFIHTMPHNFSRTDPLT
jgi:hypothetical protein